MRDELLRYYPDVHESRVHVVGTPQFDPYGDKPVRRSREQFFAAHRRRPGASADLLLRGDNGINCPEDHAARPAC